MTIEDRRVRRTKQRLQEALMSLILEKSYDKVTVKDLIDRADVGRSTFYDHYETKDDLLTSGIDRLTADIELHMSYDPSDAAAILPSLGVFNHVAEHPALFKALIGGKGVDIVHRAALQTLTQRARSTIDRRTAAGEQSGLPPDARAAFAAGSLLAILAWWLDNDLPHPPDAMAAIYRQMTATA